MKKILYLIGEEWLPVVGAEDKYIVSNKGRIKSLDYERLNPLTNRASKFSGQFLTPINSGKGYFRVRINYKGNVRLVGVHVLVASAFIENPCSKKMVHHLNCNTADNRLENLKWVTHKENCEYSKKDPISICNKKADKELESIYSSFPPKKVKRINRKTFNTDSLDGEIWKFILGSNNQYSVSNLGRVKSHHRMSIFVTPYKKRESKRYIPERIMKIGLAGDGYASVGISFPSGLKTCLVHQLVATLFIENPDNKTEVNHIDGNKLNNVVENLEWSNRSENNKHSFLFLGRKSGRYGKRGKDCPTSKRVKCETLDMEFESILGAATILGVSSVFISNIASGKRKHTKGLTFRYL